VRDKAGHDHREGVKSIDFGTVFLLDRAATGSWSAQVLYSFCARGDDGFTPYSIPRLILDKSGNLLGTTRFGGTGTLGNNGMGGGTV
jgi:hypothetical protein